MLAERTSYVDPYRDQNTVSTTSAFHLNGWDELNVIEHREDINTMSVRG
ncbi:hypothetical protein RSAG8_12337, partial [Rhizoctonia solani AG-8 WAC10335]